MSAIERPLNKIIVHCSATPPDMDVGWKEIDRWHRERGWLMGGYHAVIRRNGKVEQGRPLWRAGAHAQGHNHDSIGVCLIGGVERTDEGFKATKNFTNQQMKALWDTIVELTELVQNGQEITPVILGHRDLPDVPKECPCFDVERWIKGQHHDLPEGALHTWAGMCFSTNQA